MDTHNLKYIISFLLLILFMGGCSEETDTSGCPYPDSCNYNPDGTDEDWCWYAEDDCICEDGEGITADCFGECGGDALIDECGECGGNGIDEGACDCDGNVEVLIGYNEISIQTSLEPWGLPGIIDEAIFIFSENCSDDYDSNDIPEPPAFGTNWIKTYFHYPDWDSAFGNDFTETCHSNIICDIKEFGFFVESNAAGAFLISILFPPQSNLQIEIFENNQIIEVIQDQELGFLMFSSSLQPNIPKEFLIKVSVD